MPNDLTTASQPAADKIIANAESSDSKHVSSSANDVLESNRGSIHSHLNSANGLENNDTDRYRSLFNEVLVGAFLLVILSTGRAPSFITIFLGGALISELILILADYKILNARGSDVPTGSWLIIPVPTILAFYDPNTAVILTSASFLSFALSLIIQNPTKISLLPLTIWLQCVCIIRHHIKMNFILTFIFLSFILHEGLFKFPKSLTIWEALVIAQICYVFNANTSLFIIPLLCFYSIIRFDMKFNLESFGVLTAIAAWLISLGNDFATHLLLTQEEYSVDPLLLVDFNPLKFIFELITPTNIILVTTLWLPLLALALLVVIVFGTEKRIKPRSTFALRKLFHFEAGVVYATGLLVSPQFLSVAAVCVLLAFLVVEWVRLLGVSFFDLLNFAINISINSEIRLSSSLLK